jgi:ribosomal-protein-alanine N-acetyltransferase
MNAGGAVRVVRAGTADAPVLRALLAASGSTFDADEELARPHAVTWLANTAERSTAGFLLGWQLVDELEILDLFVLATERRRGLARALLRAALDHARASGKHTALLEVRKGNLAARQLYQSFGLAEVGERRAYYGDGEDALLLRLEL